MTRALGLYSALGLSLFGFGCSGDTTTKGSRLSRRRQRHRQRRGRRQ